MGTLFAMELKETHLKCGTHYELWLDHGAPFVYCPKCDKSWEPCESAWEQYRKVFGADPLAGPGKGKVMNSRWKMPFLNVKSGLRW